MAPFYGMNRIAAAVLHAGARKRYKTSGVRSHWSYQLFVPTLSRHIYESGFEREYSDVFSFDLPLITESRTYPRRQCTAEPCHRPLRKGRRLCRQDYHVHR